MSNPTKIQKLKAQIAVQRAEKAASEARKSTQDLQKLENTLKSPQVREATAKVVKQAAESAVDNIIKEKKINNEIKVKTAKQLEQQAEGAREILEKKKGKKSWFNRKTIFLLLLLILIGYLLWRKRKQFNLKGNKPPSNKKMFMLPKFKNN